MQESDTSLPACGPRQARKSGSDRRMKKCCFMSTHYGLSSAPHCQSATRTHYLRGIDFRRKLEEMAAAVDGDLVWEGIERHSRTDIKKKR